PHVITRFIRSYRSAIPLNMAATLAPWASLAALPSCCALTGTTLPGGGSLLRLLPTHHLGDPRRRVGGRAVRRRRVVLEHAEPLPDRERPGAVLGVLDPDLGEAGVHRPLEAVGGVLHLRLDDVEQSREVQPLRPLDHAVRGEVPPGARDDGVRVGEPGDAEV